MSETESTELEQMKQTRQKEPGTFRECVQKCLPHLEDAQNLFSGMKLNANINNHVFTASFFLNQKTPQGTFRIRSEQDAKHGPWCQEQNRSFYTIQLNFPICRWQHATTAFARYGHQ